MPCVNLFTLFGGVIFLAVILIFHVDVGHLNPPPDS